MKMPNLEVGVLYWWTRFDDQGEGEVDTLVQRVRHLKVGQRRTLRRRRLRRSMRRRQRTMRRRLKRTMRRAMKRRQDHDDEEDNG